MEDLKNNEFENLFRSYTNSKHAISVSSCTAGLFLLYYVLGIKKNDVVIVSSQTHAATALSFCAKLKPIFNRLRKKVWEYRCF